MDDLDPFDGLDDLTDEAIATIGERARLPRSDLGNARRLIAQHGDEMAFVIGAGWAVWDGKRWLGGESGYHAAIERAHNVADSVTDEAWAMYRAAEAAEEGSKEDKMGKALGAALLKWAVRCGERGKTSAMLGQAESMQRTELDAFDPDPLAINVGNGIVEFEIIERDVGVVEDVVASVAPHDPDRRCTRLTGTDWEDTDTIGSWESLAPEWAAHLQKILPDDAVREFFHRAVGYMATGLTREQCMFMLQGRGGDGKSLTMSIIRAALGDYSIVSDVKTWLAIGPRGGDGPSEDRARLAGASRLVSTAEPPTGSALNDELIKKFTGGDTMTARGLNLPTFQFDPVGKLVMEVNQKPRIKGDDDGIWRRIWVVPFRVQIPREAQDLGLKARILKNELQGVLCWIIEGTRIYLEQGLAPPAEIIDAVAAYRAEANPFGEWYRECCLIEDDAQVAAKELYDNYVEWCEVQGYEPAKQATFGRALGTKQHPKAKANLDGRRGVIVRKGLRLDPMRLLELGEELERKRAESDDQGRIV